MRFVLLIVLLIAAPGAFAVAWYDDADAVAFSANGWYGATRKGKVITVYHIIKDGQPQLKQESVSDLVSEPAFDTGGRMLLIKRANVTEMWGLDDTYVNRVLDHDERYSETCTASDLMLTIRGHLAFLRQGTSGKLLNILPVVSPNPVELAYAKFLPGCKQVMLGQVNGRITYIYDTKASTLVRQFAQHASPLVHIALHPKGDSYIAIDTSGFGRIIPLKRDVEAATFTTSPGWSDWSRAAAYSPNGEYVAYRDGNTYSGKITVVSTRTGGLVANFSMTDRIWDWTWLANSRGLLIGNRNTNAFLGDVLTGGLHPVPLPSGHYGYVWSVDASADGRFIAIGSYSGLVIVLNNDDFSQVSTTQGFKTQNPPGQVVRFAQQSPYLLTREGSQPKPKVIPLPTYN